jgi:hypothetical protein
MFNISVNRWQKHTLLKFLVCALAFSISVIMINQSEEDKFISSDRCIALKFVPATWKAISSGVRNSPSIAGLKIIMRTALLVLNLLQHPHYRYF